MSRGFNLLFRMYMEGVLTPFKSANIICTPNGVEASINIFSNKMVYDLKPKTAIQIFYKDWTSIDNQGWRLMFDGFFSAIIKEDNATEGRMVSISCRDFRADIRKAPAYLSYTGDQPLGTINMYAMNGLYETGIVKGTALGSVRKVGNREYENQSCNLAEVMRYIAGTAYNKGTTDGNKNVITNPTTTTTPAPEPVGYVPNTSSFINYSGLKIKGVIKSAFKDTAQYYATEMNSTAATVMSQQAKANDQATQGIPSLLAKPESSYETMADSFQNNEEGKAKCGLFLDAFIRGLWSEAAGGTAIGVFMNKRIRMDKRFFVPQNRAGYNFWNRKDAALEVGGYMMSDSRFSSLEAAIMRCAALFMVRVYSCNTPTLIPVSKEKSAHNPYSTDVYAADVFNRKPTQGKILDFIIDDSVRENLIDNKNNNFGGKYILNETMLLPPLEFTAPPNCNIFLPPFCNRTSWQFDTDAEITRGYYSVVDSMSGYGSDQALNRLGIQVPNTLFDRSSEKSSLYKGSSKKDEYGRFKPPITLEERYKGISLSYGEVNEDVAKDEVVAESRVNKSLNNKVAEKKLKEKAEDVALWKMPDFVNAAQYNIAISNITEIAAKDLINSKKKELATKRAQEELKDGPTTNALRRHALIKYLNEKYAGNVMTIDMMFNPYPMCGFPGMFVDDEEASGAQSAKTVLGMVQQVKHIIAISPGGAEASTTVLMNNARFVDNPTDMDIDGNALYLGATDKKAAEIDIDKIQYIKDLNQNNQEVYRVPDPVPATARVLNSKAYDMALVTNPGKIYAKDFLSISTASSKGGRSNIYYLDKEYDPQHISLFYKKVLLHNEQSFMIGSYQGEEIASVNYSTNVIEDSTSTKYFIYDTMHEAVIELRANRKELLYDYDAAMKFVSRNICSADAFYQGILGLSVLSQDNDGNSIYVCNEEEFDDSIIYDEYFGITTEDFNKASLQLGPLTPFYSILNVMIDGGLLESDGDLSSILETTPITAFIKERKQAVKNYINEANKFAQGIRFTVPEAQ